MKPSIRSSESDRILRCNGSLSIVPKVQARESGPEAEMGTGVHWIAHDRIKRELGAAGNIGPRPYRMESALKNEWVANFYFRHVQETVPADWSLECEADLDYEFDQFILTGHPDDIAMNPDATEAIGFDLKAGYITVDIAEINSQVLCYACLLYLAYPTLKKITYYIVQPRASEDDGEQRISSVVIDDVPQAVRYLESEINKAIKNNRELNTGPTQCKYCPAKLQCEASIKLRNAMKHILNEDEIARVKREPDDTIIADWYIDGKVLSGAIDEATKIAKERIKTAGSIESSDGTKLGVKIEGGSYEYNQPIEFLQAFRNLCPKEESLARCYKPSKAKIFDELATEMNIKKTSKKNEVTCETIWDGHFRAFVTQGERVKIIELI